MLNPNKVQALVLAYKSLPKEERVKRNQIVLAILSQYKKLFNGIYKKLSFVDKNIFDSIINYELVTALDKYDPKYKAKFVTFFYYITRSIARKVLKEHNHIESRGQLKEPEFNSVRLLDIAMDLDEILEDNERLLYFAACKNRVNSPDRVRRICEKIMRYANDGNFRIDSPVVSGCNDSNSSR